MNIDHLIKFAEAYPIPDKEASTVVKVLIENIFPRFRVPLQLLSDIGEGFEKLHHVL